MRSALIGIIHLLFLFIPGLTPNHISLSMGKGGAWCEKCGCTMKKIPDYQMEKLSKYKKRRGRGYC